MTGLRLTDEPHELALDFLFRHEAGHEADTFLFERAGVADKLVSLREQGFRLFRDVMVADLLEILHVCQPEVDSFAVAEITVDSRGE